MDAAKLDPRDERGGIVREALGNCNMAETLEGSAFMERSKAGVLILKDPSDFSSAAVPSEFSDPLIKRGL
jgi:hypothetical protein